MDERRRLEDLYKQVVLDHYRRPRRREPLAAPDAEYSGQNPVCGDAIVLQVRWSGDRLEAVAFFGRGCTLCLASGSIMAEWVCGREKEDVRTALARFERMMAGEDTPPPPPESVAALAGVRAYPAREECVRLAWRALAQAVAER